MLKKKLMENKKREREKQTKDDNLPPLTLFSFKVFTGVMNVKIFQPGYL